MRLKAIISSLVAFVAIDYGISAQPKALYQADTVSICIMGDMMMHSAQIADALQKDGTYDFSTYFTYIEERIKAADIAIANMEFTLGGEPYSGYPAFSAPDSYASYLAGCGFDIFLAANNHIFDKSGAGAERTLSIYRDLGRKYGIQVCGLAEDAVTRERTTPLKVLAKGMRIGIVNFTYGTNSGTDLHWPKTNYMNERTFIRKALERAQDCDLTLVLPHWGTEYELLHSPAQEVLAGELAENGADIIIGSHPHVPQDFKTIGDVPVAYSLGNGVSNMSAPNTQLELMAEIKLVRELSGDTKLLPVRFTYLWCSRPGGLCSSYTVIPVKDFIGKRNLWQGAWDYDKMMSTYERVRNIIGIEDN